MSKTCNRCGEEMRLSLRNVVYRRRAWIRNVPVYVCANELCVHSQVVDLVKNDLKRLMDELGPRPDHHEIRFDQLSEFTRLLLVLAEETEPDAFRRAVEERVNELLDLYLLAQSLGDERWMGELRDRLTQMQSSVSLIKHLHAAGSRGW